MTPPAAEADAFGHEMHEALKALTVAQGREGIGRALEHAEAARRLNPESAEPLFVLGVIAFMLNDVGGAIRILEQAHKIDPDGKEIVEHLGALHGRAGNIAESLYYTKLGLTLDENPRLVPFAFDGLRDFQKNVEQGSETSYLVEAHYAFLLRKYDGTVESCRRELELRPQSVEGHQLMGRALVELGRYEEGTAALEAAARLAPRNADGFIHWAEGLLRQGRLNLAHDCCREAVRLAPASVAARSALLTTLAYLPFEQWAAYPEEARAAIAAIAPGARPAPPKPAVSPKSIDIGRASRIRIGYLINETTMTRDLGFIEAVLAHHNHGEFFVHGYQQYSRPFSDTTRLQKNTDDWRQVFNIDDETLALIVTNDALDILVDCCGAARDGRPAFLARRPAPIQIGWFGFPQGPLPGTVDWLVSAASTAEFDARDAKDNPLLQLSLGPFAYNGLPVEIAAAAERSSPAAAAGQVTFGGALDPARLVGSAPLWSEVLRRAPGAQLLLGREPLPDHGTQARVRALFADDVAARVVFQETPGNAGRLADFYAATDVLLDTLPVNGSVETCEALSLGIPVVSCRGDRRVAAVGTGILSMAGRGEWAAKDQGEFVNIATYLASDIPALAELRKSLPEAIRKSPLCDAKRFAFTWETTLKFLLAKARGEA